MLKSSDSANSASMVTSDSCEIGLELFAGRDQGYGQKMAIVKFENCKESTQILSKKQKILFNQFYRQTITNTTQKLIPNSITQKLRVPPKPLPLLLLIFCFLLPSPASSTRLSSCLGEQQESIFHSIPSCQTRPTLVDLRDMFSNHSQVIQVVPDHVSVDRCGGSCYAPSHSCNPTVRSINKMQVMLVMSKWPHGKHETLCTEVEVETHHACQCGCQVQPDQCLPELHYYHQPSCR